jgi:predicted transcriptional regulator
MRLGELSDILEKVISETAGIATLSAGIDGINRAVRALYSYKGAATYKDLAKGAGIHPVYMSQCLSAARDVGLTESAGKRGLYKLTTKGEDYARHLSYGEDDKARDILRELLLERPAWTQIIKFLKISFKQERNPLSLVADVEGKLGKHWSETLRNTYATTYSSVLEFAGLIETSGKNIISKVADKGEQKPSVEQVQSTEKGKTDLSNKAATPEGYSEFSIPESFKIFVRKNIDSLKFFESQVKDNSIFIPWLQHETQKLEALLRKSDESKEVEKGQAG